MQDELYGTISCCFFGCFLSFKKSPHLLSRLRMPQHCLSFRNILWTTKLPLTLSGVSR